jgi:uncharacterized protein YukJ
MLASLNIASLREFVVTLKFFSMDIPHFCFACRNVCGQNNFWLSFDQPFFALLTVSLKSLQLAMMYRAYYCERVVLDRRRMYCLPAHKSAGTCLNSAIKMKING